MLHSEKECPINKKNQATHSNLQVVKDNKLVCSQDNLPLENILKSRIAWELQVQEVFYKIKLYFEIFFF